MRRLKLLKIYFIFLLFILFVLIANMEGVYKSFSATLTFNMGILTIFIIGIIVVLQSSIRLTMLAGTFGAISYKKGDSLEFYLNGIGKLMPATIANMFEKRARKGVLFFTDSEAKDVSNWLEDQFFNTKGYISFFVGTSLMIGLFGTFTGLLVAIDDMGAIILSLGGDINIGEIMAQFSGPLGGMAVGFSSSLFGVASAIVLNIVQYILSRQQAAFSEDVQDWLKLRLIDSQNSETLSRINDSNASISDGSAVDTKQLSMGSTAFMDVFVESISELSHNLDTANKSSELIYKQLIQYLDKSNKSNNKELILFDNISSSLKELNINQFSTLSTLEDALDRVTNTISNEHRTLKQLVALQEENNKLLTKKK
jgi:hypothetical protein